MIKIPLTCQSLVSTFDNKIALLYFGLLTMKMIKLDFNVFTKNVHLFISFQIKNHLNPMCVTQDVVETPQGVKAVKLPACILSCISSLALIFSFYHFKP